MLNRFKKILIVMASVLLIPMLITGFLLLGSCSSQPVNSDITVTKMPDINIDSADKTVESDNQDEIIVVYSKPSVKTLTVFKNTEETADTKTDNTNSSSKEFSLYISQIKTVSNRVDVITPTKNADTSELIKILNGDPNILCAGKNFTRKLCASPNNLYYSDQWWFTSVGADKTWDKVNNKNPVVVAVIDSGLDMTHENILERYVSGYDYIANSSNIIDLRGHGTMVSGCIASAANTSKGIAGVAGTANIKIAPYRTGGMSTSDDDLDGACIVAAIYDAADRPEIKVINMSFCGYYDDPYTFTRPSSDEAFNDYPEYQAIKYAASKGKVLVAAAGNEGSNPNLKGAYSYPASYSDVISVAATTSNDMHVSFSQYNDEIELSAPGQGIVTLSLKSDGASEYTYGNGTSFSSSIVAGLAAVLFADNPDLTAEDVRFILNNTAQDIGKNKSYFGSGKVRIDLALAESRKDSTVTNTETDSVKYVSVTGIGINPKSISLSAGQTRKLSITIKPSNAANKNYILWSDNEKVATVDKSGLVKAVGNGTAKIYAAAGDNVNTDIKVSCTVTVSAKTTTPSGSKVAVSSIGINPSNVSLNVGQTKKLTITIKPSNAANKNYILWSDNKEVATVDKTGVVTAVGAGNATIHATTEDGSKSATCTLTVVESNPVTPTPATPTPATPTPDVSVTGVSISPVSVSLNAGQTKQLTVTIQPSNAANKNYSIWSDNPGIATVSQSGLITAVKNGTATIYAETADGSFKATCSVTVVGQKDGNTYDLTVECQAGGKITVGESGSYVRGEQITLTAVPDDGYRFAGWISLRGGKFDDAGSASTTFIMSANDTTVTAMFIEQNRNVIYVSSTDGDDANSGLWPNQAWKTLDKVTQHIFRPGDTILFKAGDVWDGQKVRFKGSGSQEKPIIVDQYGSGNKPRFNGNGTTTTGVAYTHGETLFTNTNDTINTVSATVELWEGSYWTISNLEITNYRETEDSVRVGIALMDSAKNATEYAATPSEHVTIQNCYIHDVNSIFEYYVKRSGGIVIFGNFNNITIDSNVIENVGVSGIRNASASHLIGPEPTYYIKNYVYSNNILKNIAGDGICMGGVNGGRIEYNWVDKACCVDGGAYAAVWSYACKDVIIQYNEVSNTVYGGHDGQAILVSSYNENALIQYNYTHGNDRTAITFTGRDNESSVGTVYRYNVSVNDGLCKNTSTANLIGVYNKDLPERTPLIYNNLFYQHSSLRTSNIFANYPLSDEISIYENLHFKLFNNIIIAPSSISFTNRYVSSGDIAYNLIMPNEILSKARIGQTGAGVIHDNIISSDKQFIDIQPGQEPSGIITGKNTFNANALSMFKLKPDSPCIGTGTVIPQELLGSLGRETTSFFGDRINPAKTVSIGIDGLLNASIPVSGIRLSHASISLNAGQTKQLEATIQPSNAENKAVYYWSDNPSIATVDQTGLVTAVSGGPNNTDTANIYVVAEDGRYSSDPKTAVCTVMVFMLSDSTETTTGSITERTNILKVESVIDFKVRQGIAIENLEQVSYNEDGSRRYTWFVAKILDINAEKNEIKINRPAPFSISNVTVKHDNTFIFSDTSSHGAYGGGGIAEYIKSIGGNKNIVFPKGVYEINAVWVNWLDGNTSYKASGDVPSNGKDFDYDNPQFGWFGLSGSVCLPLSGVENVTLDFSNSNIKINGDIYMNNDYGTDTSRTRPMEFLNITNSDKIIIKNLDIDGGGLKTDRSQNVVENWSYAIEMRGAVDCKIINVKASHFVTDAVLVAKSDGTNGRTSKNIYIDNLVADRNARQGMSVCNVNGITIKNSKFMNSGHLNKFGGHEPNDGIDFELEIPDSNLKGNYMCDITVDNVIFYNNKGSSFKFYQFSNTIPKDTDPPEYTPTMNNIKFSNIFSYQPNGDHDFHFGSSCKNLVDVTITDSIFINKPAVNKDGKKVPPTTDIIYQPNFDLKFERCSFLGAFFWDMHKPKLQLEDCNFLLDRYSRFMFESGESGGSPYNYFDIKDSFFYFTEQAVEDTKNYYDKEHPIFNFAGLNFDGGTIYNEHANAIELNFFTGSFYSGLKDTKILGNGGLYVNFGSGNPNNQDLRNKKVTVNISSQGNVDLSSKDLLADEDNNGIADEVEQAKAKYNELKKVIIQRIKDNGFENYN